MKRKEDLRIIKTKKALYNSLVKLMKENSFEQIKVSDICEDSLINRSTFYSHYNDKYELLYDYVKSIKKELLEILNENKKIVNTKEFYIEMIKLILNYLDNEKNTYYKILINDNNNFIKDILTDVIEKDIYKRLEKENIHKKDIPTDIFVTFYLNAVSGVIIKWIINKNKYKKEEIIYYLNELIPENLDK